MEETPVDSDSEVPSPLIEVIGSGTPRGESETKFDELRFGNIQTKSD